VFASTFWNPAGKDGLAFGATELFLENLLSVAVAGAYAAGVSFVLLKVIDKVMGLRPDPEIEHEGLDGALHGEEAYAMAGIGMRSVPEEEEAPVGEASPALMTSEGAAE
jgi:Amt family ammonium transporter